MNYRCSGEEMCKRIVALAKADPVVKDKILTLDSPGGLFQIEGFRCDDLGPTLAQAQGALSKAKSILRRGD